MCDAARAEKARLRRALLAKRRRLDAGVRAEYDCRITGRVLTSSCWMAAETIFCYIGVDWEISTAELLAAAFVEGRRIAVPLCMPDGGMEAHEIVTLDALVPGAFGIPEPGRDTPVLPPQAFDLAIVPAVAFDCAGFRIGRGGGYYDRYLAQMRGVKAGLCYRRFLLPSLPREPHDERVDMIFTEEGEYAWV